MQKECLFAAAQNSVAFGAATDLSLTRRYRTTRLTPTEGNIMNLMKTSLAMAACLLIGSCTLATANMMGASLEIGASLEPDGFLYVAPLDTEQAAKAVMTESPAFHQIELYALGDELDGHIIYRRLVTSDAVNGERISKFKTDHAAFKVQSLHKHRHNRNCPHIKTEVGWRSA
ncbi:MAG: hypothetical protein QM488_18520 [Rhizobiaceae bacterium]